MSDIRSFARYLAVATVVGLLTVGLREVLAVLLPSAQGHYAWTMTLSYAVGVVLSYFAQARITFATTGHRPSRAGLAGFAALALLSALLTVQVAYVLRFGTPLQAYLPALAPALGFALAAVLVAPVSFFLGRQVIFVKAQHKPAPGVREPHGFWLMLLLLVAGYVAVVGQVLLRYNAQAIHDQALLMHMAQNLADGHWLGAYTHMTLVKGPGFALWLAAIHTVQLPISWAAALTYALPCVLIYFALRALWAGVWLRLAVLLALLLCPVVLSGFLVLRELIYPALTLLVVACGLGLALRLESLAQRIQPWAWAVALGLTSAFFALTREESIWLAPLWLALAWRAVWLAASGRVSARVLASAAIVTALTGLLPLGVVASLNQHHYGVFTVLELNSRPFVSAYGALARVRSVSLPQVPVPRAVWGKVAAFSPAFAEINVHLQGPIGKSWVDNTPTVATVGSLLDSDPEFRRLLGNLLQTPQTSSTVGGAERLAHAYYRDPLAHQRLESFLGGADNARGFFETKNEIGGGWFLWALRDSAAAAGHHVNAVEADRFYRQLANEVNTACEQGLLACEAERHTLRPAFHLSQLAPFGAALLTVSGFGPQWAVLSTGGPVGDLGTREQLAAAEAFVHQRLAAGRATLPVVAPIETLLALYNASLPWVSGVALVGWLLAWPRRHRPDVQRKLWWIGLVLLALVLGRLALVALIHVTSWPVIDVRYLSAAHPLLVLFDVIGLTLLVARYRPAAR